MAELIVNELMQNAPKMVVLVRMTPLSTSVLNGLLAVTEVEYQTYLIGSYIGMIPEHVITTMVGSTARSLIDILEGTSQASETENIVLAVQIAMAIVVSLLIGYYCRKAMANIRQEQFRRASQTQEQMAADIEMVNRKHPEDNQDATSK
eukprot:TRINITY_DN3932_c0_g1_i1.p2 TRINITY_DN3932_c0_g1~~TRINITY_DN3932_c0_g1_i1.p2  ORF type:complete len:149 (+),score=23.55 TRINITY_DN3932_c0_g1_i1:515-961(+)